MKSLNITSTQTFIRIIALMKDARHLKINNAPEAFMPLSVEFLYFTHFGTRLAKVYSLAHYYEQNGDLVPDPDMTFMFIDPPAGTPPTTQLTTIYPMTFQNLLGYEEAIFQNNHGKWQYKPKTLSNLIDFSHIWLKNIKFQQEIN